MANFVIGFGIRPVGYSIIGFHHTTYSAGSNLDIHPMAGGSTAWPVGAIALRAIGDDEAAEASQYRDYY